MYFFSAVNIFLIIFTFAECNSYHPNIHKELKKCKPWRMHLRKTENGTECNPRPELVKLEPQQGYEYHPSMVLVNKCAGACVRSACMPTKMQPVEHFVTRMEKGNYMTSKCVSLLFEEHTDCGCDCVIKPKDCNPEEEYDSTNCSCKCKNDSMEKAKCEKKKGMMWFESICQCMCVMKVRKCTNGLTWNQEECECK